MYDCGCHRLHNLGSISSLHNYIAIMQQMWIKKDSFDQNGKRVPAKKLKPLCSVVGAVGFRPTASGPQGVRPQKQGHRNLQLLKDLNK